MVKHVDSNGNISLRYTQLEVQMPDLSSMEGDIQNIYSEINSFYDDINYLSSSIDDLSTHLSGDYWEQGGDETVCYGYAIGDQFGCQVIDLEDRELVGSWHANHMSIDELYMGCTYFLASGGGYVDGGLRVGCSFEVGNSYLQESSLLVGCSITIGGTTINEAQLSALLALI